MKDFLCIDPGISGTGIAVINNWKLVHWKNIWGKGETFVEKADFIMEVLTEPDYEVEKVYIEWPNGQFSGSKGLAARNSNSILKLCYLIGRMAEYFKQEGTEVELLDVRRWRGTIPDAVLKARVFKYWKRDDIKAHSVDSCGMARYLILNNYV